MIKTYVQILSLFRPHEKRRFIALMVLSLFNGIFEAVGVLSILPFLRIVSAPEIIHTNAYLSQIYEWLEFTSDRSFMVFAGAGVFGLILLSSCLKALTVYAVARFSSMYSYSLSSTLLQGFLFQPYTWFLGRNSSDLGKTILSEVAIVVNQHIMPAMQMMATIATAVCVSAVLFAMEPYVAFGALFVIGGSYLVIYLAVRARLTTIGKARVAANRARFKVTQEATGGIKDVKIMGLETSMLRRYRTPARRMAKIQAQAQMISGLPRHGLEAVSFGGLILLILHLIQRSSGGIAEVLPVLGLVALAGARLFPTIQSLFQLTSMLNTSRPALEALMDDLREIEVTADRTPLPDGPPPASLGLREQLELRDVTFAYPQTDRSALTGLTMQVKARSVVGLVGGTGAGKTTAVDVILSLLRPKTGQLIVDGTPITDKNRQAWQRSIGYVPQQIFLTDETVAANIAFGLPKSEIDMEAVERAARVAALHDFVIEELPSGYETIVGERGVRLSGGQRQRIGIARALYHDPDVLILDEATSALDNITEEAVMDAVHNLGGAKTIIMIAHRLTTVESCDQIYLLEQGKVSACGTYAELVEGNETFRRMARVG